MSDCQDYGPLAFAALDEVVPMWQASNPRTLVAFGLSESQVRALLPKTLRTLASQYTRLPKYALRAYPIADGEEIPRLIERELAEGKRDSSRRGCSVPCYVIACPRGARALDGRYRLSRSGRARSKGVPAWVFLFDRLCLNDAAVLLDADEFSSKVGRDAVYRLQEGLSATLFREPRVSASSGTESSSLTPGSEVFPSLIWKVRDHGVGESIVMRLGRRDHGEGLRGFTDGALIVPTWEIAISDTALSYCHITSITERSGPFGVDRASAVYRGFSPLSDSDSLRAIARTVTEQTWVPGELEDSGGFIRRGLPRDFVPRRLGDVCKVRHADEVDKVQIEEGNVVWLRTRGTSAGSPAFANAAKLSAELRSESVGLVTREPLFLLGCLLDCRFMIQVREKAGGLRGNPISSREHVEECVLPWVDSPARRTEMLRQLDELRSAYPMQQDSFFDGPLGEWYHVVWAVLQEGAYMDQCYKAPCSLIDAWAEFPRYQRTIAELAGRSAVDSGLESPAPLAFLERRRLVERDPRAQIRHVRDLYETAVRLDCLVLFAALRSAAINSRFEEIMQTVVRPVVAAGRRSPTAFRPAIGTWLQCASALRRFIAGDPLLAESMRVGFDIARSVDVGRAQRLSDSIVAARNADSHSVARSVSEAFLQVDDASEWDTDIHQVYRYLWQLEWYVSVGLEEDGADRPILKVDVAHGSDPLWRGEGLRIGETQAVDALTPGRVVLRSAQGNELLSLHPFVQCHPARGEGHDLWMLSEIVDGRASLNCAREGATKQESRGPMPGFGWLAR